MSRVLLTGAGGQLGWELQQTCPAHIELFAYNSTELDIRDELDVSNVVAEVSPTTIINAAAYTAVDKAESEQEIAYAVNADGAGHLAQAAQAIGARMIQLSTDYVFDGMSSSPYLPDGKTSPLGVYGASKHLGEMRVREVLPQASVVLRTSWLYSTHGSNFVKSMLRLMAEREELCVVADQVGTPTYARTLASAIWELSGNYELTGVFHWTDAGLASWYDFAVAIMEEAIGQGLLSHSINVRPIRTCDYPTPVKRPAYSVLDKSSTWEALSLSPQHWRESLRDMLADLKSV